MATITEGAISLGEPWICAGQPYPAPRGCFELGETEDFVLRQNVSYQPLVTKSY